MTSTAVYGTEGTYASEGQQYDAILIVSFGGPEGQDDVIPYLENVLRGKRVPRERLEEVAGHYRMFGGVSPINDQNRALIAALKDELAKNGPHLPVYWGNRNWHPFLEDTLREMRDHGVKRALALFTTAYSSYSSCRQYREDIERARENIGDDAPIVDKIRVFYNHPAFIKTNAENLHAAINQIPEERRADAHVVFTGHSLPVAMAKSSAYSVQIQETSRLVAEAAGVETWHVAYQSRSGPPHQPWLEPDICDFLEALHSKGVTDVVVLPIGFISDHLEVLFDLDVEAQQLAEKIGLNMVRAATVGVHPSFIAMIRELIAERMSDNPQRRAVGRFGPSHDVCGPNCCQMG